MAPSVDTAAGPLLPAEGLAPVALEAEVVAPSADTAAVALLPAEGLARVVPEARQEPPSAGMAALPRVRRMTPGQAARAVGSV